MKTKNRANNHSYFEYQINIVFDSRDEIYVARVPELENCHSHGKTPEETLTNISEAIELWLESAKKRKMQIPIPISKRKYSGKFVVRTPIKLHAILAQEAQARGKSLNELIVDFLSQSLHFSNG
mgnify:CR=1 FL=1